MNVEFEKIRFRNFLSFGNIPTELELGGRKLTHIIGENLDEGGSSGAGKTTLISALSFCLFDKVPAGVTKDRLINSTNDRKTTTMSVEVEFSKGDVKYRVLRARGANTEIRLYEDGVDVTPDSVRNFDLKIEDLIGFSYALFSKIILFEGGTSLFLNQSVGEQRRFIEELLKITRLSRKADALKTSARDTEKAIDLQKVLTKQQEIQNETHRKHIVEAEQRLAKWEVQRDDTLKQLHLDLRKLDHVDFEAEEAVHLELSVKQKELDAVKRERDQRKLKVARLEKELTKLAGEVKHLRDAKCPYCLQKYESTEDKIAEVEASMLDLATQLSVEQSEIQDAERKVVTLQASINETKEATVHANLSELIKLKTNAVTMRQRLVSLVREANPHIDSLEGLRKEGEVAIDYTMIDQLTKLWDHQKFLVKLLTDKSSFIRKHLIGKTIPFLNKRIAYYTEKLNLPHVVLFQPDMSCEISQYNRVLDHGNLSNGEKKKLNISLCLAFRDVLTYLSSKVNVLFTDEIDGGSISGGDVEALISLLKQKAWDDEIAIYVVSHRPEFEGRCDESWIVRKEKGFSQLIQLPE